ncbi:DUF998 domain-containing protein [Rugosimonospora africana]|uniref:DUF998 domain-containing protein n=1 Tax=Rugosimonospora africana TaxID=556532 RepID=A0A8J3QSJ2_9ACTN|nr:DUF998 domain-containing protein [Rugosimonospora africana]GIH14960.1 hypothetical protein Raf01_31320 [Rugosimonospora africana]
MDLSQLSLRTGARLGAWCWAVAAPLFLAANVITGLGWHHPAYSWATDNISDLGNVHCGMWDTTRPRQVCSPWHPLMNTSIVLTAVLLAAGLILTWRTLGHGFLVRLAQSLLLLAAVGYVLAGRFPADVDENLHFLGALLIMVMGNLGLPLAGFAPRATVLGRLRALTLIAGVTALAGAVLFFGQRGLGVGVGAMERVAVFPLTSWCCCVGVVLLAKTHRARTAGRPGTGGIGVRTLGEAADRG